jgi:hypothetical protein
MHQRVPGVIRDGEIGSGGSNGGASAGEVEFSLEEFIAFFLDCDFKAFELGEGSEGVFHFAGAG